MSKKIILAYSGGLDTSVAVKWLTARGHRVICFMADVGQGGDFAAIKRRALAAGAVKVIAKDLRRVFAREFVLPALQAHAVYEGKYLLATALSRPLIAQQLVETAHAEGAGAVAHGCTGKGNDQVRFEVTIRILDPALQIVAPVREWEMRSRDEEIDYAKRHRIPIDVTKKSPYSLDLNLWGVSIEAGALEDPWQEPPADCYQWTKEVRSSKPAYVEVGFRAGVPTTVNGRAIELVSLIQQLNRLGGAHGVGRSDLVENRLVGIKSREIYEAPAGTILHEAHQELERLVLDRELFHFKQGLALKYAELIYYGLWYSPLKAALDGFIKTTQQQVTGTVRLKLHHGSCITVGRRSPHSRYQQRLATYSGQDHFDQKAAEGFIALWGLPYQRAAKMARNQP